MSDLVKRLRKIAKDRAFKHHHVNMYAPGDKTAHKDFIEWQAADEIERLQKRNALLEDVAVAADAKLIGPDSDDGLTYPEYFDAVWSAIDKLREVE